MEAIAPIWLKNLFCHILNQACHIWHRGRSLLEPNASRLVVVEKRSWRLFCQCHNANIRHLNYPSDQPVHNAEVSCPGLQCVVANVGGFQRHLAYRLRNSRKHLTTASVEARSCLVILSCVFFVCIFCCTVYTVAQKLGHLATASKMCHFILVRKFVIIS